MKLMSKGLLPVCAFKIRCGRCQFMCVCWGGICELVSLPPALGMYGHDSCSGMHVNLLTWLYACLQVCLSLLIYPSFPPACSYFLFVSPLLLGMWAQLGHWCWESTYTSPVGLTCYYKSMGLLHGPSLQMVPNIICEWSFTNVSH